MAKKTYQVKQEDSFSTIAKKNNVSVETLKSVNPGVQTVKQGQVIKVPKATEDSFAPVFQPTVKNPFAGAHLGTGTINIDRPAQTGMYQNSPYTGFQTPTSSTAQPNQTNYAPTSYMNPNLTKNPNLAQNRQPYFGSSSYLNPAYQTPQNTQPTPPAPKIIPRPQGIFTGDPNDPNTALWRNYWNAAAQNPNSVEMPEAPAPFVMTREQIWEMKAAARQRRQAGEDNSGSSGGGSAPVRNEQYQNQDIKTVVWGI